MIQYLVIHHDGWSATLAIALFALRFDLRPRPSHKQAEAGAHRDRARRGGRKQD